jgi:hypothetical protein
MDIKDRLSMLIRVNNSRLFNSLFASRTNMFILATAAGSSASCTGTGAGTTHARTCTGAYIATATASPSMKNPTSGIIITAESLYNAIYNDDDKKGRKHKCANIPARVSNSLRNSCIWRICFWKRK